MTKPNILITVINDVTKEIYFPPYVQAMFAELGNVTYNPHNRAFTPEELKAALKGADICATHWGCPKFTEDVLSGADKLKLIAHATGTIAEIGSLAVYERGIPITSSNDTLAKYVAEGVLAYILAAQRQIPYFAQGMKPGAEVPQGRAKTLLVKPLFNQKISLIGLGSVGRHLLPLLKPFGVSVRIYDPYIKESDLVPFGFADLRLCPLDEALAYGGIVSIHAAMNEETRNMLGKRELALIRDGALLVNTARSKIIDTPALLAELKTGRFSAVLDVFDEEPLPKDSPLRGLENAILQPHMCGTAAKENLTLAAVEEVRRFIEGKPLQNQMGIERFKTMTRQM